MIQFPANVQSIFQRYQQNPRTEFEGAQRESLPGADSHHLALTYMEEAAYIKQADGNAEADVAVSQENVVEFTPKMLEAWNQVRPGVTELKAEFAEDGQSLMRQEKIDGAEVTSHFETADDGGINVFQAYVADGQTQVYIQNLGPRGQAQILEV